MLSVLRHDVHKFTGDNHKNAKENFAGVSVNQAVPMSADGDAAALSRPQKTQKQTVPTHTNHYRLSLFTGETVREFSNLSQADLRCEVLDLIDIKNAKLAHEQWLLSEIAAGFNESVYYPYTSLKYHTLLVAALFDNYRSGNEFADLQIIVDPSDESIPFRTVFRGTRFGLRIDTVDSRRPSARLGSHPWQSWASAWNQLTAHPLSTDHDKYDMMLDANLRRIKSWSTALQYIEDFESWVPDR